MMNQMVWATQLKQWGIHTCIFLLWMYEITSRENRFCNGAAWGLFSLSVYIKVYTHKKCYKEVMVLLRGVNSHWLKEVKSYQSVTFLLRVARKLRFTLNIIYILYISIVTLCIPVIINELDQSSWSYWKFKYVLKNHMKLTCDLYTTVSQINLFRGEVWRYAKEVTSLLVFKLNYPPSPSATE